MALHALEDIDDAVDATKALLLPFEWGRWLRLALVALFVGGASGPPTGVGSGFEGGTGVEPGAPGAVPLPVLDRTVLLALVGLALAAVLLALLVAVLGSVMEFVFVAILATEAVQVRQFARAHLRDGLRLFGFRIGLFLLTVLPIAILVGLFLVAPPVGVLALLGLPILLLYFLLLGLVQGFTTVFVVPTMLREDCGVLAGWRRLWPTVRGDLKEFGAYAVLGFVLNIGAGIVVGLAVLLAAFVLAIPVGLLFGIPFFLLSEPANLAVAAVGGLVYALGLLVAIGLAQAPVQTFLRYYALFVLGDVDPDLDLIAGRRAAIRADGTGDGRDARDSDADADAADAGAQDARENGPVEGDGDERDAAADDRSYDDGA
jgi:hypothetical protein